LWGSDFSWQGVATVDYRLSHKMMLAAGWRYFKVNYDTHDFRYNIAQSGPILGLRYTF
jgi:opacity protein-like surface antigen